MLSTLRLTALAITFLCLSAAAFAQNATLLTPAYQFSKQKTSFITLKSGEEIEGEVTKFKRKRGMIEEIRLETADGKEREIPAGRIKSAYLYPSAFSRISSFFDDLDVQRWGKDLNEDLFKNGYVYLETVVVQLSKKKKQPLLLQLLNPHFADGIRIYDDPLGSESTGIGMGPVKLAGGNANSYYALKEGDRLATYLHKGQYKKTFANLYQGCSAVLKSNKAKWKELADHVYLYSNNCAQAR